MSGQPTVLLWLHGLFADDQTPGCPQKFAISDCRGLMQTAIVTWFLLLPDWDMMYMRMLKLERLILFQTHESRVSQALKKLHMLSTQKLEDFTGTGHKLTAAGCA